MGSTWKLDPFYSTIRSFWILDVHSIFLFLCFSSADNTVRMFDRRKLNSQGVGSLVYKFEGHDAPVLCVQVAGKSCLASINCSLKFKCVSQLWPF
jgi:WD40 repeat protein